MLETAPGGKPVLIEVLAVNLSGSRLTRTSPAPRGQALAGPRDVGGEDAYRLLSFLDRLLREFGRRITIHLVEPMSLVWMMRVLRHRPRRYPAFVVGGRRVVAGLDETALKQAIVEVLQRSVPG